MGFPAKKILTECRPTIEETYSHRHTSGEVCRTLTGTEFLFPDGSRIMTSGTPLPASFVKMSKYVGLLIQLPSGCRPGPDAVTFVESPACPST